MPNHNGWKLGWTLLLNILHERHIFVGNVALKNKLTRRFVSQVSEQIINMQKRCWVYLKRWYDFRPLDLYCADAFFLQIANGAYPLLRRALGLAAGGKLPL